MILGNNIEMNNMSYKYSSDEQKQIAHNAMSITPPEFPNSA
jgi:hypothetical protein